MSELDFIKAEFEEVPCNLCGNEKDFKVIETIDRNKLPVKISLCKNCGLMFINPRMTKKWYDLYYQKEYRRQTAKTKKRELTLDEMFENAERYGYNLASLIKPYINSGLTVEVGSGVGGVLSGFKKVKNDIEVVGIEPSKTEADYAINKGIKTYIALFEDINENIYNDCSNILCIQSFNHLLNPRQFLIWTYNHLEEDGNLIMAVSNFRLRCKRRGKITPQIDHTFMFTPETLKLFVESAGFAVLFFENPERYSYFKQFENKKII